MGLRFRKSVRLGKGVRLNVSKSGLGMSVGGRGMRYSVHSSGRRTTSIGIPGSGLGYVSSSGGGRRTGSRTSTPRRSQVLTPPSVDARTLLPKPGLLSSKVEKRYYDAVQAFLHDDCQKSLALFAEVLALEPDTPSAHLFSALCIGKVDRPDAEQVRHLEAVAASEAGMPDRLQSKYLPPSMATFGLNVKITDTISAQAPFDAVGATLMLAELYQTAGRLDEAIGLVQQLHEANPTDPAVQLSLADLLMADGDHEGVVEVAAQAANTDDVGVALLHLKGGALFAMGHQTGALDAFRDGLAKVSGRDPELLKAIRYDRALAYEAAGQKGRAKQDLERLYATDPGYEDVRERLTALA